MTGQGSCISAGAKQLPGVLGRLALMPGSLNGLREYQECKGGERGH